MRRLAKAATFFLGYACAASVSVASTTEPRMPAPDPSVGDGGVPAFYDWREAIPSGTGKFLRSEDLPPALGLANAARATRFLYTSRDPVTARPTVVSGAIFVPKGTPPKNGWPLIAWAHGTTGMADVCAPSSYPRSDRDRQYLNMWLAAGFAIVASDYQGLGTPGPHPYNNFRSHAYAVLDSIRAVPRKQLHISSDVILLGQSQGAGTVVAAAGYAPSYAPDINLLGTVATGVPNFTRTALEQGGPSSVTSVMATAGFTMMAVDYAQSSPNVTRDQLLTPAGQKVAELVKTQCFVGLEKEVEAQQLDPQKAFLPGVPKRLFMHDLEYRIYPSLKLSKPLFIGIGAADTTTTASAATALAKQFCSAGSIVEAHVYVGKDHNSTVNTAAPDGLAFARKLLARQTIKPVCEPTPQS